MFNHSGRKCSLRKLLISLSSLAFSIAVSFLAGCADTIDGVTVIDKTLVSASTTTVTGSIANFNDFDKFNSREGTNARTILPEPVAENYEYYLYGEKVSKTGVTFGPEKQTLSVDSETGKTIFKTTLEQGEWELTLYALKTGTPAPATSSQAFNSALFMGKSYCFLKNFTGTASFTLSADRLTGSGNVNITVRLANEKDGAYENWTLPEGYSATAEIQNLMTSQTVSWANNGNFCRYNDFFYTDITGTPSPRTPPSKNENSIGSASHTLNPGTYNLLVKFYDNRGKELSCWSDVLVVKTNRTISKTISIPKMIDEVPSKVTSLKAGFIKDSEDSENHSGYYQAFFKWNAENVINEKYFELEVADITDVKINGQPATIENYDWSTPYTSYTPSGVALDTSPYCTGVSFAASSMEGSLNANNDYVSLYLKLGQKYTARIRSVNAIGTSGWETVALPVDGLTLSGKEISYFATDCDGDSTFECASSMNRFKVTYVLNGGCYTVTATSQSYSDRFMYYTQDAAGVGVKLWNGEAVTAGAYTNFFIDDLHNSNGFLTHWVSENYYLGSSSTRAPNSLNTLFAKNLYYYDTSDSEWKTLTDKTESEINDPSGLNLASKNIFMEKTDSAEEPDEKFKFKNPNYKDSKNITVYAIYPKADSTPPAPVIPDEHEDEYVLYTNWISVNGSSVTSSAASSSGFASMKLSGAQAVSQAVVTLTIPADTIPENYTSVQLVLSDSLGNKTPFTHVYPTAANPQNLAVINFATQSMGEGIYTLTVTAYKNLSAKTIERTVRISLILEK